LAYLFYGKSVYFPAYRIIFDYAGEDVPLFLLNVFTKGDRANLSKSEQKKLRVILGKMRRSTCRLMRSGEGGRL
jgi:hypothetical protein